MLAGLVGLALIVLAWLVSFDKVPPLRLSALYAAGSLLLTIHAWSLGDVPFLLLNAAALIISVINIARALRKGRGCGRRLSA